MDWPSFDAQPNALPLAKNIVERLTRYESNLAGIKRDLDEVNRKVDFLLRQPTTNHGPGFNGPFAPGNVTPLNGSRPPTSSTRHEFPSDVVGPNLILTQTGPLDFEEFNSLGVFEEGHPRGLDFNLAALPQTLGDLYTLLPKTLPVSMVFRDGVWADPPPLASRTRTNPLPPVAPGYDVWSPGRWDDKPPDGGGGTNDHQSAGQWTVTFGQEADVSTSLATAKPIYTENGNQSESSSPATSSPGGGYDRRKNAEETARRLARIREVLRISWTNAELETLQEAIKFLGGTVPTVGTPTGWIGTADKGRRRRGARRACYEELQRLVGPLADKLAYVKVLDNVLETVAARDGATQSSQWKYDPYRVFRLEG